MDERRELIKKLTDYFARRGDISMAFLFGSQAMERAHASSDWDIAAYFKTSGRGVEWEESEADYPKENEILADLMAILRTDKVDFVVLNRAPVSIADAAIRGEPLVIKERSIWLDFMMIITREADDFRAFAKDYHDIYMRSSSLNPGDAERFGRILEFIENQTTLYAEFSQMSLQDYEKDLVKRNSVERWVENMVNAVTDISKLVLSSGKKTMPYGYADTVRTALIYLKIEEKFWNSFLEWIKLRNILAHEYIDIKWKRISGFIQKSEPQFKIFLEAAKKFLEENR